MPESLASVKRDKQFKFYKCFEFMRLPRPFARYTDQVCIMIKVWNVETCLN